MFGKCLQNLIKPKRLSVIKSVGQSCDCQMFFVNIYLLCIFLHFYFSIQHWHVDCMRYVILDVVLWYQDRLAKAASVCLVSLLRYPCFLPCFLLSLYHPTRWQRKFETCMHTVTRQLLPCFCVLSSASYIIFFIC